MLGQWMADVCGIGSRTPCVSYTRTPECGGIDIELPFKVLTHLSSHLVDLQAETGTSRRWTTICWSKSHADDLGGEHEGRCRQAMS